MEPIDKASRLALLTQSTEGFIQKAALHYQPLDEATLNRPSPTGGWSITQCLAHLNSYGDYYLPHLRSALTRSAAYPSTDPFASSWLGTYLTRLMHPTTGRRKFKAASRHLPPSDAPAPQQVIRTFISQQEELCQLMRQAANTAIGTSRIPLSVASWIRLPPGDILDFLVAHTERHLQQADRNSPTLYTAADSQT